MRIKALASATIAAIVGGFLTISDYHDSSKSEEVSELVLENIEALSDDEGYTSLHWEVRYLSLRDHSYRCDDGGTTVCPYVWPY